MTFQKVIPFAHNLINEAVQDGDIAIDATVGNGHDTLLLANIVGENGKVYGFDIQASAIENTQKLIDEYQLTNRVKLYQKSHTLMIDEIPKEDHGKIAASIFNLGYLPGGDKSIVTRHESTIQAIEQLFTLLKPKGIIVLVVYPGHPEGQIERDHLLAYLSTLSQDIAHVIKYEFINQRNNPPFVIGIKKR